MLQMLWGAKTPSVSSQDKQAPTGMWVVRDSRSLYKQFPVNA